MLLQLKYRVNGAKKSGGFWVSYASDICHTTYSSSHFLLKWGQKGFCIKEQGNGEAASSIWIYGTHEWDARVSVLDRAAAG